MKTFFWAITLLLTGITPLMSRADGIDSALIHQYFHELQQAMIRDHGQFWGLSMDGPIFCIDPDTREIVANCQSAHSSLRKEGDLYRGTLPVGTNSANSIMNFEGENWTMVMWPLPADDHMRLDLMIHESFHRIQKYLGFKMNNPMVSYLDKKDARILFRMEINALYKAISSRDGEMSGELQHALYFRNRRFTQFPDLEKAEILLETNEGLAQYTGYHMVYHLENELKPTYFADLLQLLGNTPSLVRSSAYFTGPMYGELLDRLSPGWNRTLPDQVDFLSIGMKLLGITPDSLSRLDETKFRQDYGYEKIVAEETLRQVAAEHQLDEFRNKFLGDNAFTIHFKEMNIVFNPGNLVALDDTGTVYPNCKVSDYFGALQVKKGALMFNDWKSMNLTPPNSVSDTLVTGDGWEIHLNPGWAVRRNMDGKYELKRK
ncbi:MAG: hypothetical protein M0Q38_13535 [Bacteroidales bacterium]|jgi:hypothetical protein|nr:hypothetical protein [Bacteroidales bacterium]